MAHEGIDISGVQHPDGSRIDLGQAYWALRNAGGGAEPFIIIKADEGTTYVNPSFVSDLAAARAAGFRAFAAYHFAHPADGAGPEDAHFRSVAGGLPKAEDLEVTDGLTWAQVAAEAQGFLSEPGEVADLLYTNLNYLWNVPGAPFGHLIWFAGTAQPPPNSVMWQYGTSMLAGIPNAVDRDRWVGSEEQFASFFGLGGSDMPKGTEVVDSWVLPGSGGQQFFQLHADGGLFSHGLNPTLLHYVAFRADGAYYTFGPRLTPGVFSYPGLSVPPRQPGPDPAGISYFTGMHVIDYNGQTFEEAAR